MNPYLNKGMITNPVEFYGREEEIENIYERITTSQNTFIVGARGLGKSSLLSYLYHKKDKYLDHPERYIFLFIGIQRDNISTPQDFFTVLLRELGEKAKDKMDFYEAISYENVRKAVSELDKAGCKLIMFIDEFDIIADSNAFDETFYANLRALIHFNVAYVIASVKRIREHGKIITSPFFNIFIETLLLPFSKKEAKELIKNLSTRQGVLLREEDLKFIFEVAGSHPFFIQIACSVVFNYKSKGKKLSKSDYDKIREEIWDKSEFYFEDIWKDISKEEREVLSKLARSKTINERSKHKLHDLEIKGYVIKREQGSLGTEYEIFSSIFKKFVIEKGY